MESKSNNSKKLWIVFGAVTIISGIILMIQQNYLIGVPGTVVGVWLFAQNVKDLRK